MLDPKEMVQFWPQSEICWCQNSEAKPGLYEQVLNIKHVIMIALSENTNHNICKKHEIILELFYRGRADNKKHMRNLELFSKDFEKSVYEENLKTRNTFPVDSAEMKVRIVFLKANNKATIKHMLKEIKHLYSSHHRPTHVCSTSFRTP